MGQESDSHIFQQFLPTIDLQFALLHPSFLQLLPPRTNSSLECAYHQRDSSFIGHFVEFKNLFNSQYPIHKFFGFQIPVEFRNIEFESTHQPIGMSLCKVLISVRLPLRKLVSRSTPFVTTQVGYLGSEVFNLIPHSPELILLVQPTFNDRFAFCLCKFAVLVGDNNCSAHYSCVTSELPIAPYVLSLCARALRLCLQSGYSSSFIESN